MVCLKDRSSSPEKLYTFSTWIAPATNVRLIGYPSFDGPLVLIRSQSCNWKHICSSSSSRCWRLKHAWPICYLKSWLEKLNFWRHYFPLYFFFKLTRAVQFLKYSSPLLWGSPKIYLSSIFCDSTGLFA